MLRIGTVVMGVEDMQRASAFWRAALGYVPRDRVPDDTWVVLLPPDGAGTVLALGLSESPVQEHPRVHLDLYAGDAADQAAEVDRLVALGAERVDWDLYPDDADFIVLADTEGNRFCVIDTGRGRAADHNGHAGEPAGEFDEADSGATIGARAAREHETFHHRPHSG